MSRYLVKSVETYRVDSESEAKALIEEAKRDNRYSTSKYMSEYKEAKQKGEVVDSWYRVTITKAFTSEKEPDSTVSVSYDVDFGSFPAPTNVKEVNFTEQEED